MYKALELDYADVTARIVEKLRHALRSQLHRRGFVVGISGGIDSSVSTALAVSAIGSHRVFGVLMPEADSSPDSLEKGQALVQHLGIDTVVHDISSALRSIGCYSERDDAIRRLFPKYSDGWKNKIVISGAMEGGINHFKVVVEDLEGNRESKSLPLREYLTIVAATNYKQRIRKTIEYFHADRMNYAVIGTPNRLEYDQGFFVKNGDGSADIKPIAHLYKTQVYELARFLGLPKVICDAIPTTDTYSLEQGQDEFYFALPYEQMDIALWHYNNALPAADLGKAIGTDTAMAERIFKDIETKRRTTRYLHLRPILIEPVELE